MWGGAWSNTPFVFPAMGVRGKPWPPSSRRSDRYIPLADPGDKAIGCRAGQDKRASPSAREFHRSEALPHDTSALAHGGSGKIATFYPSTVAIDEAASATAEYAMAKIAGEILAKYLNEHLPDIAVVCRCLPRILTDQTATIGVAGADNALDVMLPVVYDVQRTVRPDPAPRG